MRRARSFDTQALIAVRGSHRLVTSCAGALLPAYERCKAREALRLNSLSKSLARRAGCLACLRLRMRWVDSCSRRFLIVRVSLDSLDKHKNDAVAAFVPQHSCKIAVASVDTTPQRSVRQKSSARALLLPRAKGCC